MTRKQGKRDFGTIRVRPSGRVQASWTDPDTGRRETAPLMFETKKAAREYLDSVRTDLGRDNFLSPKAGAVRLRDYAPQWLASKPTLRPRTVKRYAADIRLHIAPTLGSRPLRSIDTATVRAWNAELVTRYGPESPTPALAYRTLHVMLKTAADDRLIIRNPCTIKGASIEPTTERPIIEPADVYALASFMPEHMRALVMLFAFAGLRLGEALGLARRHVDLLHGTVSVERQRHIDNTLAAPKSKAGVRVVPIPTPLADLLRAHVDSWAQPGPDGLVFVGARFGHPLDRGSYGRAFAKARARVPNIPAHFRSHDLRHTGATLLAQNGATTKELMRSLGHATPAAALRYQHVTEKRLDHLAELLGAEMDAAAAAQLPPIVDIHERKSS